MRRLCRGLLRWGSFPGLGQDRLELLQGLLIEHQAGGLPLEAPACIEGQNRDSSSAEDPPNGERRLAEQRSLWCPWSRVSLQRPNAEPLRQGLRDLREAQVGHVPQNRMKVWIAEWREPQHPLKDIAQRRVPGDLAELDPLAGVPEVKGRVGRYRDRLTGKQFAGEDPKGMEAAIRGPMARARWEGRVDHADVSGGRQPDPLCGDRCSKPTEPFEHSNEDVAHILGGGCQSLASGPCCPHQEGAPGPVNGSRGMSKIPGWDEGTLLHG